VQLRAPRARESGFSVIIVLILLIMLVGIAMILLSTSRSDVFSAANERESAIAFYAAEAGVNHAKSVMATYQGYTDVAKFTPLISRSATPSISRTIDYQVNGVTIPARYEVWFFNNTDGSDGGVDLDGMLLIHSVGYGPNSSRSVIETVSGIKELVHTGTDYCAQANPPPSCRGL
jgi:hypothetical protein